MGTHNKKQKSKKFDLYSKFSSCGVLAMGIVGASTAIEPSAYAQTTLAPHLIPHSHSVELIDKQDIDLQDQVKKPQNSGTSHHLSSILSKHSLGEIQRNIGSVVQRVKPALTPPATHISAIGSGITQQAHAVTANPTLKSANPTAMIVNNAGKKNAAEQIKPTPKAFTPQVRSHLSSQQAKPPQQLPQNTQHFSQSTVHTDSVPARSSFAKDTHSGSKTLVGNYRMGAVRAALSRLGKPYSWGSIGPNAFDCSGLMVWSYQQVGITLPRNTWGQLSVGTVVTSIANLEPGDLIIYAGGTHVGMYIGNNLMIHSPETGQNVEIAPVASQNIYTMRRVTIAKNI